MLTATSVAAAVAIVAVFSSVMFEIVGYLRKAESTELSRILVFPKLAGGSSGGIPMNVGNMLREIDGVVNLQRVKTFDGRHDSGAMIQFAGEEVAALELNRDLYPVPPDVLQAWKAERIGAIATDQLAADLHLRVGQTVELPSIHGPVQVKIVGITHDATIARRIAIHFEYADELIGSNETSGIRVFTQRADYARVARAIEERTKNSEMPVQAIDSMQYLATLVRQTATVPAVLGFLGAFLMLTTVLTLANGTAITIRERRIEIATLRVLGFRRGTIVRLLLGEAVLVGIVGGALAIGVTWWSFDGGVRIAGSVLPTVEIGWVGVVAGVATAIALPLAGALPATVATVRAPLVVALRDDA